MASLVVISIMSMAIGIIIGAVVWTAILTVAEKHEQAVSDVTKAQRALKE